MSTELSEVNPYATPAFVDERTVEKAPTGADQIRRQYRKSEQAISSSGTFIGCVAIFVGICAFFEHVDYGETGTFFVEVAVAVLLGSLCYGLWSCQSWARWPAVIVVIPMMIFGFPIGTVLGVCVLHAVLCKKSRFVLTAKYRKICRQAKRHSNKTTPATWIVLGMISLAFAAMYVIPAFIN